MQGIEVQSPLGELLIGSHVPHGVAKKKKKKPDREHKLPVLGLLFVESFHR